MPTDLQRIELAFPAEAMLHVVNHGADPKGGTLQTTPDRLSETAYHMKRENV